MSRSGRGSARARRFPLVPVVPGRARSALRGAVRLVAGTGPLRVVGLLLCIALLGPAASAGSTDTTTAVDVVKVASDGSTVIARQTVDYHWLEASLPVRGDGSTHYYHQGPTNDPADLWDPAESKNFEDDDMGALKGTAVRDICNRLVGGMSPGDTLEVIATDGLKKRFSYGTVYSPSARQGPMVLTWFRGGDGYVPAYWSGMKIVFFADTSTNTRGWHVFGLSDMRASMPESEWYYKLAEGGMKYPSTTGLAIRNVKELRIRSIQAPGTAATTVAPTKTPTPTVKPTGTVTTTTGGTGTPTSPPGTTAVPATTAPAVTTLWPDNDGGAETVTPVPSDSVPGAVTPAPTPTATAAPVPGATSGANMTPTGTGVPSPTADATPNRTANATVTPVPTTYERTYEYSVSPEFGYSVVDDAETTATTATPTPTPSPDPTATATGDPPAPVVTTPDQVVPATPAVAAGSGDRSFNRSVSFTFSVRVHESGDPALAAKGALSAWLAAFLQAFAYIAGAFLP